MFRLLSALCIELMNNETRCHSSKFIELVHCLDIIERFPRAFVTFYSVNVVWRAWRRFSQQLSDRRF